MFTPFRWIFRPLFNKAGSLVGHLICIPICIFRLLSWQIIIVTLVEISFAVVAVALALNIIILLYVQEDWLILEPLSSSLLSLVLPLYQIPSAEVDQTIAWRALAGMTLSGNALLMIVMSIIFGLNKAGLFSPWTPEDDSWPIHLEEDWFHALFWTTLPLFRAATLPTFCILATQSKTMKYHLR